MKVKIYGEVDVDVETWRSEFAKANPDAAALSDDNIRAAIRNGFEMLFSSVPNIRGARAIFIPELFPDTIIQPVGVINPSGRITL